MLTELQLRPQARAHAHLRPLLQASARVFLWHLVVAAKKLQALYQARQREPLQMLKARAAAQQALTAALPMVGRRAQALRLARMQMQRWIWGSSTQLSRVQAATPLAALAMR